MNIIAKPTTGSERPVPADRQRPMEGPASANPDIFLGQHRKCLHSPACPRARRSDRLEVDRGILLPEPPRARVGDKKRPLAAGHQLGDRGCCESKAWRQAWTEPRPFAPPEKRPVRAQPFG